MISKQIKKCFRVLLLLFVIIILVACKNNKKVDGQVPVYLGMELRGDAYTKTNVNLSYSDEKTTTEGDTTGKDESVDQEEPFEDIVENPIPVEEKILASLDVYSTDKIEYYATQNQDIFIVIKLSNPDNYEILSFTLNGEKYQSYQFQDGSDGQNLILKKNVGAVSGIVSYTIDAIKYVNGTSIEDVKIEGDKTVKAGIKTPNQVSAEITSENASLTTISLNVYLKDTYSIISQSSGYSKVVLFDGREIVEEFELVVGSNDIVFEKLNPNTVYQYAVFAYYDNLSGAPAGASLNVLKKKALQTEAIVLFDKITADKTSIGFDFVWSNFVETKQIVKKELFLNDVKVKDITTNLASDLLSNNTYKIVATYLNLKGEEETISFSAKTLVKTIPTISFSNPVPTKNSFTFKLDIKDDDFVGSIKSVSLYKDDTLQTSLTDYNKLEFSNLLSDNTYKVIVNYEYDLNEGNPKEVISKEISFKTLPKEKPTFEIIDTTIEKYSVKFSLDIIDIDSIGKVLKVDFYLKDKLISSQPENTSFEFKDLYANNTYTIKVKIEYDLNDGSGKVEEILDKEITTLSNITPKLEYSDIAITKTSFSFKVNTIDPDKLGSLDRIDIYKDSQLIKTFKEFTNLELTDLLSNNTYKVVSVYKCDLKDGEGVIDLLFEKEIKTNAFSNPSLNIVDLSETLNSVMFNLNIKDTDEVGNLKSVSLYLKNELIKDITDFLNLEFNDLLSNTQYTIKVIYEYDLNDGNNLQEMVVEKEFKTLSKKVPTVKVENLVADEHNINFDFNYKDENEILNIYSIKLFQNGNLISETNGKDSVIFTNLTPDKLYKIEIYYNYNLNEGKDDVEGKIVEEIYTKPFLNVLNTKIINTDKITEKDTVVIESTIQNPGEVVISHVVINGVMEKVHNTTTFTYIRVEMILGSGYRGGETDFVIEEIIGTKNGIERRFSVTGNNVATAFVNGDINVVDIQILDEFGAVKNIAMIGETYYLRITFDNPSLYPITNINYADYQWSNGVDYTNFTVSDNNSVVTFKITNNSSYMTRYYYLKSFTYEVGNEKKIKNVDNIKTSIVLVISNVYQNIYNASDLANIKNGYAYRLANDIDMTNVVWQPKEVSYIILDGNGYSINNFRNVQTIYDTNVYYGLFKRLYESTVINLNINEVLIMLTLNNSNTSTSYHTYVGALAGEINNSKISNVSVTGQISVNNNAGDYNSYVGGLIGTGSGDIKDVVVNCIIDSSSNASLISSNFNGNVSNVFAEGTIYTEREAGGLFSYFSGTINDCYSIVDIYITKDDSNYAAGFIGYAYQAKITNCYSKSNIYYDYYNTWNKAQFISQMSNSIIENSFSLSDQNIYNSIAWSDTTNINNFYRNYEIIDSCGTYDTKENIVTIFMSNVDNNIWNLVEGNPVLKFVPSVRIISVNIDKNNVSFYLKISDNEKVGEVFEIAIYQKDELIQVLDSFDLLEFKNLKYNTNYIIKVTYRYKYNESDYEYVYVTFQFQTEPVEGSPELFIEDIYPTSESVEFKVKANDINSVGSLNEVFIYDANYVLLHSFEVSEKYFLNNLLPNTPYIIYATYLFDLNDGLGEQQVEIIFPFMTNPAFEVVNAQYLNTTDINANSSIIIQININNPNEIKIDSITIKGVKYQLMTSSTNEILRITVLAGQFGYGLVRINIEKINGIFNGVEKEFKFQDLYVECYINADIYLEEFQFVDYNGNELEYILKNQAFYEQYKFYNPSLYKINKIDNFSNFDYYEQDGDYTYIRRSIVVTESNVQYITYCNNFNYTNDYLEKSFTKNFSTNSYNITCLISDEIRYIKNASDLANIESGYYYKLANDIDLNTVNWISKSFHGYIDGNNYAIKNLKIIASYDTENTETSVGLFSYVAGSVIKNLYLENFTFLVNTNSSSYTVYLGNLAGNIQYSKISFVHVVNTEITLDGTANLYYKQAGGIAGYGSNSRFENCSVSGSINGNVRLGGIISKADYSSFYNVLSNMIHSGDPNSYGAFLSEGYSSIIEYGYTMGISNKNGFIYYNNDTMIVRNSVSLVRNHEGTPTYVWLYGQSKNNYTIYNNSSEYFIYASEEFINNWVKENFDNQIFYFENNKPVFKVIPKVDFKDFIINEYDIEYSLEYNDPTNLLEIFSIEIYQNKTLFKTINELDLTFIDGLKYNTEYELVITFKYSYAEEDENILVLRKSFKTKAINNTPEVSIVDVTSTTETIKFSYNSKDILKIGYIHEVNLYLNSKLYKTLDSFDNLIFTDLLSNSAYRLEIIYAYDFNDGWGVNYITVSTQVSTLSKQEPQVEINCTTTEKSINYALTFIDYDKTLTFNKVELYKNNVFVSVLNTISGQFNDLDEYTNYVLKVYYECDLNTGDDPKEEIFEYAVKTNPYLDISNLEILNLEKLVIYNDLILNITLDNPNNIQINQVTINNKKYNITSQVGNTVVVNVVLDKDISLGGITEIIVTSITGTLDNNNFEISVYNKINAFINGDIEITSLEILNSSLEKINYAFLGETVTVKVNFNNPTNYTLSDININSYNNEILNIDYFDSTTVYVTFNVSYQEYFVVTLYSIKYQNDLIGLKTKASSLTSYIGVVLSNEVRLINNSTELSNMENGYIYKLNNNINLSGVNWIPKNFRGVFLGNGYSINNLTIIEAYEDSHPIIGLFRNIEFSYINNLSINNFKFVLTLNKINTNNYFVYAGALSGSMNRTCIENVHTSGSININNKTSESGYAGGLVAEMHNSIIDRCSSIVTIHHNVYSSQVSGLIGYGSGLITNSYVHYTNTSNNASCALASGNPVIENSFAVTNSDNNSMSYSTPKNSFIIGNNLYCYYDSNYLYKTYDNKQSLLEEVYKHFDNNIWTEIEGGLELKSIPIVSIEDINTTESSMNFKLAIRDVQNVVSIVSIKLYYNGTLVKEIIDFDNLFIDGLRYSAKYELVVTYKYTFSDGYSNTIELKEDIYTKNKQFTPVIQLVEGKVTTTSIELLCLVEDLKNVGQITEINLYLDKVLVKQLLDFSNLVFTDLISDKNYTIEVKYVYNFLDAFGDSEIVKTINIKTLSKKAPVLNGVYSTTENSINYSIKFEDQDNIAIFDKIELYKDGVLLKSSTQVNDIFDSLEEYTAYLVKVYYSYDLNDATGIKNIVSEVNIKTSPFIEITEIKVINSSSISVGSNLILSIALNNPNMINITKVLINNTNYSIYSINKDLNEVIVEINIDRNNYIGGYTKFVVSNLTGNLNEDNYTILTDVKNEINVFINGELYVSSVEIVNSELELTNYILLNNVNTYKINLYNPSNYTIENISLNLANLSLVNIDYHDEHTIYVILNCSEYNQYARIEIVNITYSNEYNGSKTKNINVINHYPVIKSENIKYIKNAKDFDNIENGYIYSVINDIDMQGYNWTPLDFTGIIYGNNYSIKNLSIVNSYENENINIGLFERLIYSYVENLNLVNYRFIITLTSSSATNYQMNVGGFASSISYSTINNVFVSGSISVDNKTNSHNNINGFSCDIYSSSVLNNCSSEVSIQRSNNTNGYISSFAGNNHGTLSNIYTKLYDLSSNITEFGINYNFGVINNLYAVKDGFGPEHLWLNNSGTITNVILVNQATQNSQIYYNQNNYKYYYNLSEVIKHVKESFDKNYWTVSGNNVSIKRYPLINITNVLVDDSSVSFELNYFDPLSVSIITEMNLYSNNILVKSITDFETRTIDNLRYSTNYELVITYKYTFPDGLSGYLYASCKFKTHDKDNIPELNFSNIVIGNDKVEFDLNITDVLNIGSLEVVNLYHNNTLVTSLTSFDNLIFDDLLSNNTYVIEAVYAYDFDDGFGEGKVYETKEFKTLAKKAHSVSNQVTSTSDTVKYNILVDDVDKVISFNKVELYYNSNLLQTLTNLKDVFTNLEQYTTYVLKTYYTYDLNDGNGVKEVVLTNTITTNPELTISDVSILNNDALKVGDKLMINILVDNPYNINITHVYVNGLKYSVNSFINNTVVVLIDIETGVFDSGDTSVSITALCGVLDEYNFTIDVDETIDIFINGELIYTGYTLLDSNLNEANFVIQNQEFILKLTFDNPSGYELSQLGYGGPLNYSSVDYTDSNNVYFRFTPSYYTSNFNLSVYNIKYSNNQIGEKTKSININLYITMLYSDEIKIISTPSDLQNIESGYIYEFANDINLEGISWNPKDFNGIIYGNGYSINNLTIIESYEDIYVYTGLFKKVYSSYINNLNINNFNIVITLRTYTNSTYETHAGAVAGYVDNSNLENISVSGTITIDNRAGNYNYIGGIVGRIYGYSTIDKCSVEISLKYNGYSSNIGGIVGEIGSSVVLSNSYVIYNNSITNTSLGAIIGYNYGTIINCYAIISKNNENLTYHNAKSFDSYVINIANDSIRIYKTRDEFVNIESIDKLYEYLESWDKNIWDFDNLDQFGNPTLK